MILSLDLRYSRKYVPDCPVLVPIAPSSKDAADTPVHGGGLKLNGVELGVRQNHY